MKRGLRCALLLLLLSLLCCFAVWADVIYEPPDTFYNRYSGACTSCGCKCMVNSPEGGVRIYSSPQSGEVIDTAQNGNCFTVFYTYDAGAWGVIVYENVDGLLQSDAHGSRTGWVQMQDMLVLYRNEDFMEAFSDEFFEDAQRSEAFWTEGHSVVCTYSYPCSGTVVRQNLSFISNQPKLTQLWYDAEGRLWGYTGDGKYDRDWICMSDPGNLEIAQVHYREDVLYPAQEIRAQPPFQTAQMITVIALVVGLTLLSVMLLLILRRRRKTEKGVYE